MHLHIPSHLETGYQEKGMGHFQIHSMQKIYSNRFVYKGVLTRFIAKDQTVKKNIPVKIYHNQIVNTHYTYFILGKLSKKSDRFYSFKPSKSLWEQGIFKPSFVSQRFHLKQRLKRLLSKKFTNSHAKHLFISLATADVESSFLRYTFSRIGLSHILAISGFHFAFVIGFFTYILRLFCSKKTLHFLLLILSTGYLVFLGVSPSILRAWTLVTLYLIAYLIERPTSSLNLIGISLLINLLINPTDIFHLGFQFSYLSYIGIICFFKPIDRFLAKWIPDRHLNELSFGSKGPYCILFFFRKSLSLNLAVHLLITPALLFHFYKIPLYTFFYNLFIPSCIAILMYGLLIALTLQIHVLFTLLEQTTILLLKVIIYPPTLCEFFIRYKGLSSSFVTLFLLIILIYFIYFESNAKSLTYRLK